jgi:hypothetical protein
MARPDIARFADYAGVYELVVGVTRKVWGEGDALFIRRLDKSKEQLFTEAGDLFFRKGVEGRLLFRRDAQSKSTR